MLHIENHFEYDIPCFILISSLNDYEMVEGVFMSKHDAEYAKCLFESDWHYEYHEFFIMEKQVFGSIRSD